MTSFQADPPPFNAPPTTGGPIFGGARAKTSVLAVLSLVMGILGLCTGVTAPVGVILGIIAIVKINRSGGQLSGTGVAIAGTCVSSAALIFSCFGLALFLPAIAKARWQAMALKQNACMQQLGVACTAYASTHNDQFPPVDHWEEVFTQSQGDISMFITTPFDPGVRRAVAMNEKLRGRRMSDVSRPATTVLMFEAKASSPQAGGAELLPATPRATAGYAILFVDGHVENVKPERMRSVVWEP